MNKEDIEQLIQKWKILNEEYDTAFLSCFGNSRCDQFDKEKLQQRQKELFGIETVLFEILGQEQNIHEGRRYEQENKHD